jgi:hypothetical protein
VEELLGESRTKSFIRANLGIQLRAEFQKKFGNGTDGSAATADMEKATSLAAKLIDKEIKKAEQLQKIDDTVKEAEKTAIENEDIIFDFKAAAEKRNTWLWWVLVAIIAVVVVGGVAFFVARAISSEQNAMPPVVRKLDASSSEKPVIDLLANTNQYVDQGSKLTQAASLSGKLDV